jgi:hypothetical protein
MDAWTPLTDKLHRDLGIICGAFLVAAGLVVTGAYAFVDAIRHRHRP